MHQSNTNWRKLIKNTKEGIELGIKLAAFLRNYRLALDVWSNS